MWRNRLAWAGRTFVRGDSSARTVLTGPTPTNRIRNALRAIVLIALVSGCGGDIAGPTGDPEGAIASLSLEPTEQTLTAIGASVQLVARDGDGRTVASTNLHWTSSNAAVATVDEAGRVTSRGNGTTVVTAEASGVQASATIAVSQIPVAFEVDRTGVTLTALDATRRLYAEVVDANGYPVQGSDIDWSSSNPEIVAVDAMGVIRAVSTGQASVTAQWGTQRRSVAVTVRQVPATVALEPESILMGGDGDSRLLQARIVDRTGHDIPGATVEWSTTAPNILWLEAAGPNRVLVHGIASGTATVTASFAGIRGTLVVVVDEGLAPGPGA